VQPAIWGPPNSGFDWKKGGGGFPSEKKKETSSLYAKQKKGKKKKGPGRVLPRLGKWAEKATGGCDGREKKRFFEEGPPLEREKTGKGRIKNSIAGRRGPWALQRRLEKKKKPCVRGNAVGPLCGMRVAGEGNRKGSRGTNVCVGVYGAPGDKRGQTLPNQSHKGKKGMLLEELESAGGGGTAHKGGRGVKRKPSEIQGGFRGEFVLIKKGANSFPKSALVEPRRRKQFLPKGDAGHDWRKKGIFSTLK